MRFPVPVALALALAGCVAPGLDAADVVPADAAKLLPYLDLSDAHNHSVGAMHDAGWNVPVLGFSPLGEGDAGRYNQVAVRGTIAYVSVYATPGDHRPGLVVVDVADPARPTVLASYDSGALVPIDVALSEDGTLLALAGHRHTVDGAPAVPVPCTSPPPPAPAFTACAPFAPYGIQLLDVSDPAAPTLLAEHRSVPSGAHTVKLRTIGGDLYAFIASYGVSYANRLASGVEIVRWDPDAVGGPRFSPVSRFIPSEPSGGAVFVHDMWVEEHPTGGMLLWTAYWDGGVVVADVTDPASPREIAVWKEFDAATYGNVHFVRPIGVIEGRHVTVAAPEFGSAEHSGEMYVLDTTDPAAPALIGRWRLPGDPVSDSNYMHSPHNFDPRGTRIVYAHYHGGVWVLDLADVARGLAEEPAVVAYRFPAPDAPVAPMIETEFAPNVWNAVWTADGRIVASDIGMGLLVMDAPPAEAGVPPYAGLV